MVAYVFNILSSFFLHFFFFFEVIILQHAILTLHYIPILPVFSSESQMVIQGRLWSRRVAWNVWHEGIYVKFRRGLNILSKTKYFWNVKISFRVRILKKKKNENSWEYYCIRAVKYRTPIHNFKWKFYLLNTAPQPPPTLQFLYVTMFGKYKNLWRRKCVRRKIFRNVEVRVEWRGRSPLQPLLCLQHLQLCHCAICQGSSYTKNEYSFFYRKFDAEYSG